MFKKKIVIIKAIDKNTMNVIERKENKIHFWFFFLEILKLEQIVFSSAKHRWFNYGNKLRKPYYKCVFKWKWFQV